MLALDTATAVTSVGLVGNQREPAELKTTTGPGEVAVANLDRLLASQQIPRSELTQLAIGVGPGPYTSTRIGVMIALTIGTTLDIPVIGICSLDAIAQQALELSPGRPPAPFGVVTDARRKEVYWALYDGEGKRIQGPAVSKPAGFLADSGVRSWAGNGFERYPELVSEHRLVTLEPSTPSAVTIAQLVMRALARGDLPPSNRPTISDHSGDGAGAIEVDSVLLAPYPLYLRRPDAVAPGTPGAPVVPTAPSAPSVVPTAPPGPSGVGNA